MNLTADIAHLDRLLAGMPPVAALGLRVQSLDDAALKLAAPLALNVNDKGCAFGGSLASLLTLAAWGALETTLRRAGIDADVYVADSRIVYAAPLYADLIAEAALPDAHALAALRSKLDRRGRGGIELRAEARCPEGRVVATLEGRYAAVLRR